MNFLICKAKKYIAEEEGGAIVVAAPLICIVFMLMTALVFNVTVWTTKRHEIQIACDCASRAGTVAVENQYFITEPDGGRHVFTELSPSGARSNMTKVLNAHARLLSGARINYAEFNPEIVDGEAVVVPVYSTSQRKYLDIFLDEELQYYNGNASVYAEGEIENFMGGLLGLTQHPHIRVFSQSTAFGSVDF